MPSLFFPVLQDRLQWHSPVCCPAAVLLTPKIQFTDKLWRVCFGEAMFWLPVKNPSRYSSKGKQQGFLPALSAKHQRLDVISLTSDVALICQHILEYISSWIRGAEEVTVWYLENAPFAVGLFGTSSSYRCMTKVTLPLISWTCKVINFKILSHYTSLANIVQIPSALV